MKWIYSRNTAFSEIFRIIRRLCDWLRAVILEKQCHMFLEYVTEILTVILAAYDNYHVLTAYYTKCYNRILEISSGIVIMKENGWELAIEDRITFTLPRSNCFEKLFKNNYLLMMATFFGFHSRLNKTSSWKFSSKNSFCNAF